MSASNESRLWLAVHLLYPHSAQAFEVYQAVVMQAEEALAANSRTAVFAKLAVAFDKLAPISSQHSFYEFEFDQIDQWKLIYKNSQKNQLLIFVGVLIFEMKLSEIAPMVRLNHDKAQFLFHQIFKKLTQNSPKLRLSDPLAFKKQNDNRVSYLFTYENLVDYGLGQLSSADAEKVRLGLELYPTLQVAHDEYRKIITQIQNLKVLKSHSPIQTSSVGPQSKRALPSGESRQPLSQSWNKTAALALGAVAIAVSFWQLSRVFDQFQSAQPRELVIREVEKNKIEDLPVAENVTESEPQSVPPLAESAQSTSADVSVASVPEATPAEVESEQLTVQPEGGLYRGTLAVKNLRASSSALTQRLSELGASKAGEVELGWMKNDRLAYYHYIITEHNINEVEKLMRSMGNLSIKFEKHPRLVPGGSRRFIIEVAEAR